MRPGRSRWAFNGVNVYFNGIAAPLLSVSANRRLEAVVPFENLDPVEFPTSTVVILNNGSEIVGSPLPVSRRRVFASHRDSNGCLSAFNSYGTLNSSKNPAALGSFIAIFGEGAGLIRNPRLPAQLGTWPNSDLSLRSPPRSIDPTAPSGQLRAGRREPDTVLRPTPPATLRVQAMIARICPGASSKVCSCSLPEFVQPPYQEILQVTYRQ